MTSTYRDHGRRMPTHTDMKNINKFLQYLNYLIINNLIKHVYIIIVIIYSYIYIYIFTYVNKIVKRRQIIQRSWTWQVPEKL